MFRRSNNNRQPRRETRGPQPRRGPPPYRPPRANMSLTRQVEALTTAVQKLVVVNKRRPDKEQTNTQQRQAAAQKAVARKPPPSKKPATPKRKPGRRERTALRLQADRVFPILSDQQVTVGYAVALEGRVMKPLHVKGTIDHPLLASLKFTKSTSFDMEYAILPLSMRSDAFSYTSEHPDGFYSWVHGAVQCTNGRFSIPTGAGGPGDSGRPVLDNTGKVVALVLGGANEGSRTALSVVTWNSSGTASKTTPEDTVEWSAMVTALCVLGNATFPCSTPPICFDSSPGDTLGMLEDNVDHPQFYDLRNAVLTCDHLPSPKRIRRSTQPSPDGYRLATPYIGRCAACNNGTTCFSPIKIEAAWTSPHTAVLKLQLSVLFGIGTSGQPDPAVVSYVSPDDHQTKSTAATDLTITTSGPCIVTASRGFFVLAQCPPGDIVTVSLLGHYCSIEFSHVRPFVGNEEFATSPLHGTRRPCLVYDAARFSSDTEITLHRARPQAVSSLLSLQNGTVYITVPENRTVTYECLCDAAHSGYVKASSPLPGCTRVAQCVATLNDETRWVPNTDDFIRHSDHTPRGKVEVPFPLQSGECLVPLARAPSIRYSRNHVELTLVSTRRTLLTTRQLGDDANATAEWIEASARRGFYLPPEGLEFTWGNNLPSRVWPQASASGNAHGYPHELVAYHYSRAPFLTVVVLAAILAAILSSVLCCCWSWSSLRSLLRSPYALAPNATVPMCLTLLCCVRQAKADTYFDATSYLWNNYQPLFWAQLAIPTATIFLLLRCCSLAVAFLAVAGAGLPVARAHEHAANVPNSPLLSYRALVERPGYTPLPLELKVIDTRIQPTTLTHYYTCPYKTEVQSPKVKCCGSLQCGSSNLPDYRCQVFTGVYPFMWGGAQCFCESENSQMSEVHVSADPSCSVDHAVAVSVQNPVVKATLMVKVGNSSTTIGVYANGVSPGYTNGAKLIVGPLSTAWSPFADKLVIYQGRVYNYAFPEYGAGLPGSLGDLQLPSLTSKDFFANTGLVLNRPDTSSLHVPYTQVPSGFLSWRDQRPPDLQQTAPYGCTIHSNPLQAVNCSFGSIPVSIDIPEAAFTRSYDAPSITSLKCTPIECVHSAGYGGLVRLDYVADKLGSCGIHSHDDAVLLKDSLIKVNTSGAYTGLFSTASPAVDFEVSLCSARATCTTSCKPPTEHAAPHPHLTSQTFESAITSSGWAWLFTLFGGSASLLTVGALIAVAILLISHLRR
ncbi:structural polyprotein [Tai Forest alphavirus]|uniref:structural polyprotein n=1 Tax=Tai Forest alphavirus TaxID=1930825 RepID=UPI000949B378|nr:structural polyprotein [Tai Forest alphavirus]APQ48385.1 structural polyprotein [Tai Forest alphavirus]